MVRWRTKRSSKCHSSRASSPEPTTPLVYDFASFPGQTMIRRDRTSDPSIASRRRIRLMVLGVALAMALSACGGDNTKPGAHVTGSLSPRPTSPAPTTAANSSTGSPAPRDTSTPRSVRTTGKPSPKATATGGSTGALDLSCARRGVDTQGITIHTKPGGSAGFNTIYSDGSSNLDTNYAGGYGGGFADAQGMWRQTWIVPANAPPGLATVRVAVQDGFFDLTYTVATGSCS